MNLGLLDILTVQQAAKPNNGSVANDAPAKVGESFADRVGSVAAEKASDARNYTSRQPASPLAKKSNPQADNASSEFASEQTNLLGQVSDLAASDNPVVAFLASQLSDEQVGDITSEILGQTSSGEIEQLVDSILAQYGDELAGDGAVGEVVAQIQAYLLQADQGKVTITADTKAVLQGIVKNLSANVDQAAQPAVAQTTDISTLGGANDRELAQVTNALAGKIIEQAKIKVGQPEVSDASLQSTQASLLLSADKKADGSAKTTQAASTHGATVDAQVQRDSGLQLVSVDGQAKQQQAGGANASQSGVTQVANQNANALQQNLSQSNAEVAKSGAEVLIQSQVGQGSASGETTKFGDYLNVSQATGNSATSRAGDAQDVLAQIKFGTASLAAKGGRNISIQLYPKELGNVDIRMELGAEGKTRVTVIAEKTDTMNLLQKEATSLRNILQDALKTESTNLSFSFHDKSDENWRQHSQDGSGFPYGGESEEDEVLAKGPTPYGGGYMTVSEGLNITV